MEKGKLLLVDDNRDNLMVLEDMFDEEYELEFALNGKEALEKIEKHAFDVAIFDIMMPVMDGIAAVKILREEYHSDLPVIFLTAFGDVKNIHEALRLSARGFFLKPIDTQAEEMQSLIKKIALSSREERMIAKIVSKYARSIDLLIDSDSNSIESSINYFANISKSKRGEDFPIDAFKTVLQEVMLNIQYYGCFGLTGELRNEEIFDAVLKHSLSSPLTRENKIGIRYISNEESIKVLCVDPSSNFKDWKSIIRYEVIEKFEDFLDGETFYRLQSVKPLSDDIFAVHGRGYHIISMYSNLYINETGNKTVVAFE